MRAGFYLLLHVTEQNPFLTGLNLNKRPIIGLVKRNEEQDQHYYGNHGLNDVFL
jgi:hypothetical protein